MNLIQSSNLRLRFTKFMHHAAEPVGPSVAFERPGRVRPRRTQLLGAGSLQRIDRWIEQLNLTAEVLLLCDAAMHSIQVYRNELTAAG